MITQKVKESIISFLTEYPDGKTFQIAEYIDLKELRTQNFQRELADEETIESIEIIRIARTV